jgi:hypothetical protein
MSKEIACEMLANTDTALCQVAVTLNDSPLSAFTRALRRGRGRPYQPGVPIIVVSGTCGAPAARTALVLTPRERSAGQEIHPDSTAAGSADMSGTSGRK